MGQRDMVSEAAMSWSLADTHAGMSFSHASHNNRQLFHHLRLSSPSIYYRKYPPPP